jgi:alkylhydroperoxidase family enzyme
MLAFAEKVTLHAYKVTEEDVDELRGHGFTDAEILDIVLVAAARNFYSRVVDAVGAEPDPEYLDLEAGLRQALAVGRPFGTPAE